jgi:hypothetical protein
VDALKTKNSSYVLSTTKLVDTELGSGEDIPG